MVDSDARFSNDFVHTYINNYLSSIIYDKVVKEDIPKNIKMNPILEDALVSNFD